MPSPTSDDVVTIYIAEDHAAIREMLVAHLKMLPRYAWWARRATAEKCSAIASG